MNTRAGSAPYPKPSDIGGTLIRRVIALFKERKRKLPLTGKIAIATSGGVDSMVLAHLLCTYGRKVIADPKRQVTLLHFDHQWRLESGTIEKEAVHALAKKLDVAFLSIRLESPRQVLKSDNLEEDARLKRQAEYDRLKRAPHGFKTILTAHHEDDLIETLVWRFFRGEFLTHREGILFRHGNCLRPFLKVRKWEILAYQQSESVPFHEDPGNRQTDQTRAYFREVLFPQLETKFPGLKSSVMRYVKKA